MWLAAARVTVATEREGMPVAQKYLPYCLSCSKERVGMCGDARWNVRGCALVNALRAGRAGGACARVNLPLVAELLGKSFYSMLLQE